MILDEIVKQKEKEIEERKAKISQKDLIDSLKREKARSFKEALSRPSKINLIAEIKRRSPSRGIIREDLNPAYLAMVYEKSGASAISVLTDETFFGGSLENLFMVRQVTTIPLLRKDFIIHEYQIYESAVWGADAVLLIVKLLSQWQLKEYLEIVGSLEMDALVEVHNQDELNQALEVGAQIIGINNRDLDTFTFDLEVTRRLALWVPKDRIIVSESGINTKTHVDMLASAGAKAILVGSSLMAVEDPGAKVRELLA